MVCTRTTHRALCANTWYSLVYVLGLASLVGCTSLGSWNKNFLEPPAAQQSPQKVSMETTHRYAAAPPARTPATASTTGTGKKTWNNPKTWFTPQLAVPSATAAGSRTNANDEGFASSSAATRSLASAPYQVAAALPYPYSYPQQYPPQYQQPQYYPPQHQESYPEQYQQQFPLQPQQYQPSTTPPTQSWLQQDAPPPALPPIPSHVSAALLPKPLPSVNEGEGRGESSPILLVGYTVAAQDEYIGSGGDSGGAVRVHNDWTLTHLAPEDTVAHFDTVEGRVVVVPSERVTLYAPRFRSVRVIEGVQQESHRLALMETASHIASRHEIGKEQPGRTEQETRSLAARHKASLDGFGGLTGVGTARANELTAGDAQVESVMSYAGTIAQRRLDGAALALMARGSLKAEAWAGAEGVRVRINQLAAVAVSDAKATASTFVVEQGESRSVLRLLKVADRDAAHPGDIVEFTIRLDNIGNKPIGNVTLVDSLTTRLEFVDGSAEASLAAGFLTERNEAGSLVLRWEITDPLRPLDYAVIRFKCRVR